MAFNNRFFVCCVVLAAIVACCSGQLTFSPGWGKRSGAAPTGSGSQSSNVASNSGSGDNCRPTSDSLMLIYHFIQAEAQQYLECQKNAQNHF